MTFVPYRHNKSNKQDNKTNYQPTKLFNIFAGGVLLFCLSAAGLSIIGEALSKAAEVKDNIQEVKENLTINTGNTQSAQVNRLDAIVENYLDDKLELEAEDIQEILEKVYTEVHKNSLEATINKVIILDYSDIGTSDEYTEQIVNKLTSNESVTFNILVREQLTNESATERYNTVKQLASDTKTPIACKCILSTVNNIPEPNNLTIQVTYIPSET